MTTTHDGIKVAVRVRPFNEEERQRGEASIITVTGNTTTIANPDSFLDEIERQASVSFVLISYIRLIVFVLKERQFVFDHSFWSHRSKDQHFTSQVHRLAVVILLTLLCPSVVQFFAGGCFPSHRSASR